MHGIFMCLLIGVSLSIASFVMANGDRISKGALSSTLDVNEEITLPSDFRASMVHIGSWFVPTGDASGFHDVYADSEAVTYYRNTGAFPDGATLVKELRSASTGNYSTGAGIAFANNQVKQWFVMVKDSKNRFAGSGIWGEGWGWALFKPDDKTKNLATDYKADCLGCHVPAKNKDWVYTEAYPTLISN